MDGRSYTRVLTILEDGSLSNPIGIGIIEAIGLVMPAEWTAADITFQVSTALEGTFIDLWDPTTEVTISGPAASKAYTLDWILSDLKPWRFLKLRSGTSEVPVAQAADRILTLQLTTRRL